MGLLTLYAYHTWLCKGQTLEGPSKAEQMSAVSIQVSLEDEMRKS